MFHVEYSAYLQSNEGTFVALARQVAEHPADTLWWPYWGCGVPFQNTYLPLLPIVVGGYARLTGFSPALSFHQVSAFLFCLAPLTLFVMLNCLTGRLNTSFLAATVFSLFTPCAFVAPNIRADLGSVWHLRRLQNIAFYGEAPLAASLALLPLAILFLYFSLSRKELRFRLLAGVFCGLTVLANAFGAVILAIVCICLLATVRMDRVWRNLALLVAIGVLTYVWVSPLVPPSVLAAIRMNAPTVDGDFRFTMRSLAGSVALIAGAVAVWAIGRRWEWYLRFFLLFTWIVSGIVLLGSLARVYVVPQPHRYYIAMDLGLCLTAAFGMAAMVARLEKGMRASFIRQGIAGVVMLACAAAFLHQRTYAQSLIRSIDITQTAPYRIAKWMDANMAGRRVMVSGTYSFPVNVFTGTPQVHGGHEPMLPNFLIRMATFTIYSGMNAGQEDAAISTVWLQALGAHAISVPGPGSGEYYKPFVNPRKFDGVLPLLWREGDDTIYEVPSRSGSLAHLVPEQSLVQREPLNGLDVAELRRYVSALNDASMPEVSLAWQNGHQAEIRVPERGKAAVSVQVSHHPGWRAWIDGAELPVGRDGLGFLVLRPNCRSSCTITLNYDGGAELYWTTRASAILMLSMAAVAWRCWLRRNRGAIPAA